MTQNEFDNLVRGDIVRHQNGTTYVIEMDIGNDQYIALRSVVLTNPIEWELKAKATIVEENK